MRALRELERGRTKRGTRVQRRVLSSRSSQGRWRRSERFWGRRAL